MMSEPSDPHVPCVHFLDLGAGPCAQTFVSGLSGNVCYTERERRFVLSGRLPFTYATIR